MLKCKHDKTSQNLHASLGDDSLGLEIARELGIERCSRGARLQIG